VIAVYNKKFLEKNTKNSPPLKEFFSLPPPPPPAKKKMIKAHSEFLPEETRIESVLDYNMTRLFTL